MSKPYCGVRKVPKNRVRGTMKKCVSKGQTRYYGLEKINKNLYELYLNQAKEKAKKKRLEAKKKVADANKAIQESNKADQDVIKTQAIKTTGNSKKTTGNSKRTKKKSTK